MTPPPSADRNLLFGILALQMDFINREQLVAAMNAWVVQKATPIGELLLLQQALDRDKHALLQALVETHLDLHGGNAHNSLSALGSLSMSNFESALSEVVDEAVHRTLAELADNTRRAEEPVSLGQSTSTGTRFRILRPHRKGGQGEVLVAVDGELQREVVL